MCCIDDGTLNRSPTPAPVPLGSVQQVHLMSLDERFIEVLERTLPLLPSEMREEFAQLISPVNLAILAGTLAAWAASHYFGVGFVMDALLLAAGAVFLGVQVWTAASDLVTAIELTATARTSGELDEAARHLANFVAVVGVAMFMALVFRGAKKVAPKAKAAVAGMAATRYGGMTPSHFRVFQSVAKEMNRILAVRNTNPLSTRWIERGFPPKPMEIKIKTSKKTGIVTAVKPDEVGVARGKGYFVVDADGVPRNAAGLELKFKTKPEWPVEPGQVVHPQQQKPLVGDYDLLGVIDPKAKGRNLVVAASEGQVLDDWSNPEIRRVASALNGQMDQPRVMHGAHDGFSKGAPDFSDTGGSTVFFPDGSVRTLETADDVAQFYREIGRQPITGKY